MSPQLKVKISKISKEENDRSTSRKDEETFEGSIRSIGDFFTQQGANKRATFVNL